MTSLLLRFQQSVSRVGRGGIDVGNGQADVLSIHGDWKHVTRSELRTILFDYIETFYNRPRHQAGLQHHTPAEVYAASAVA